MKNTIVLLAGLALAGAAFGKINPTQPMVTGRGNVDQHPSKVLPANQTAVDNDAQAQATEINRIIAASSVIKKPIAKPAKR